jgi:phosphoenolpyruvate-protein phosphotransferase (PTS system enzyme I)
MKILRRTPASGGIASGPAFQFEQNKLPIERYTVSDPLAENRRLANALEQARQELALVLEKARGQVEAGTASIFEAHVMML